MASKKSEKVEIRPDTEHYVRGEGKTAGGRPTIDINDQVAVKLRGMSLDDLYTYVIKELKRHDVEVEGNLQKKYQHLNLGLQRMTLGNILRAAIRQATGEAPKKVKATAKKPVKARAKRAEKKAA